MERLTRSVAQLRDDNRLFQVSCHGVLTIEPCCLKQRSRPFVPDNIQSIEMRHRRHRGHDRLPRLLRYEILRLVDVEQPGSELKSLAASFLTTLPSIP